mmetsp:Transcript_33175/g.53794  ORF Transcript_33175/g.53794 Transcript_33175/m.53794 type:complete len:479 (+) Transcript_33175:221-1657(+)|eukprot:CAMPEP_0184676516 /NCGR_PEP_ID=MMETSP0308-20130426/88394_1 /TAXON_ID=38269 /ORGANISM="Gloeochaete witrockiana, Strain SAG 46.84" /LENGTH=478 /DNA_ID=CAMNT_0027124357 /DNA_START=218 /DNA_END=1654 /DNA_ORIENTATION=-
MKRTHSLAFVVLCCFVSSSFAWSIYIDCGGSGLSDSSPGGVQWLSDRYFSGGTAANNRGGVVSGPGVGNAGAVFQTERYGRFTYTIPVPSAGSYTVTLSFVEIYWTGPNQRIFNVDLQGTRQITALDIYRESGGQNRLIQRSFTVQVSSPLTISIVPSVTTDNPSVAAISVVSSLSGGPIPTTKLVTYTPRLPTQRPPIPSPSRTLIRTTPRTPRANTPRPNSPKPLPTTPRPKYAPLFPSILAAGAVLGPSFTVRSTMRIQMPPDCTCQYQLPLYAPNGTTNMNFIVTTGVSPDIFDSSKVCGTCFQVYDPRSGKTGVTLAADYLVDNGNANIVKQFDLAPDLGYYFNDGRVNNFDALTVTPVQCKWLLKQPEWFVDRGSYGTNVYIQPRFYTRPITAITITGPFGRFPLTQDGYGRWTGRVANQAFPPAGTWYAFELRGRGSDQTITDAFLWDGPPRTGLVQVVIPTQNKSNWPII